MPKVKQRLPPAEIMPSFDQVLVRHWRVQQVYRPLSSRLTNQAAGAESGSRSHSENAPRFASASFLLPVRAMARCRQSQPFVSPVPSDGPGEPSFAPPQDSVSSAALRPLPSSRGVGPSPLNKSTLCSRHLRRGSLERRQWRAAPFSKNAGPGGGSDENRNVLNEAARRALCAIVCHRSGRGGAGPGLAAPIRVKRNFGGAVERPCRIRKEGAAASPQRTCRLAGPLTGHR